MSGHWALQGRSASGTNGNPIAARQEGCWKAGFRECPQSPTVWVGRHDSIQIVLLVYLVTPSTIGLRGTDNWRLEMPVVRVAGGKTLEARDAAGPVHRIRLPATDAAELDQLDGTTARAALGVLLD